MRKMLCILIALILAIGLCSCRNVITRPDNTSVEESGVQEERKSLTVQVNGNDALMLVQHAKNAFKDKYDITILRNTDFFRGIDDIILNHGEVIDLVITEENYANWEYLLEENNELAWDYYQDLQPFLDNDLNFFTMII